MARLVVLDTETTGFSHAEGHRIVEIGCVELMDMRKGEARQWYVNPQREIPAEAIEVHGITNAMVADKPTFEQIAQELVAFLAEDTLVIHNAAFDMGFLNMELGLCGYRPMELARAIDTVPLARRKFPGVSASLDALCKRLGIDNSHRTLHGALLDAHLLAEVYVELTGGNQFRLDLAQGDASETRVWEEASALGPPIQMPRRAWGVPADEEAAHGKFLELLQKESGGGCIWLRSAG